MNRTRALALVLTTAVVLLCVGQATGQEVGPQGTTGAVASAPLGTGFTYQGQLIQDGAPVNGACDLRFTLWDAASGGNQVGWGWLVEAVEIVDGLFTARLDFGNVHDGSARWLEVAVRCPAGSGSYVTLDPRQELTAAPAALALKLPYTAQASIGGPLVAFHNTGDGEAALFQSDLGHALWVESALLEGLHISSAGTSGVSVTAAGTGLSVGQATVDGVNIGNVGSSGLRVNWAGYHAVHVGTALADGVRVDSAGYDGVYVGSAGGDGLSIASAADDGVSVQSAGGDGVAVWSAGADGIAVGVAAGKGVSVNQAGAPSEVYTTASHSGFEVAGAEGDGLRVGRADLHGVVVNSAGMYGVFVGWADMGGVAVDSTNGHGLYVDEAGTDGVHVYTAYDDGIHVHRAGNPSSVETNVLSNGVEVAGAQGHGVYVGRADNTGVYVKSSGWNGIVVDAAGGDGVRAGSAVYNAFYGNTTNASGQWGLYTPDKVYAQNVTLQTLTLIAQVSGPDALEPGDVVAADGVGSPLPDASTPLPLVRLAGSGAGGVIGVVEGRLALTPAPQVGDEDVGERLELRSAAGPARAGDFVALTILGLARVKMDASQGVIQPGTRVTGAAGGRARALKTVVIEGVTLAESAPGLGIALAAPDADGLAWVLINPQ